MTATISYEGDLRCHAVHLQSNSPIDTDAPTDNRGKGERFSPTDLVCTALGTCMVTTMAMKATDMGIELKGTELSVKKHMLPNPRRIAKIEVVLTVAASIQVAEADRLTLQTIGDNCPVVKSLHPDIELLITYNWN